MPLPISVATAVEAQRTLGVERPKGVEQGQQGHFAERIKEFMGEVDAAQKHSGAKMEAVAEGRDNDLHGTMIAMEEAGIQLRLMATVRNKVIEAYREVMRMGA